MSPIDISELDLFAVPPDPARPEREPRKCSHPRPMRRHDEDGESCLRCGHRFDAARQRLGRTTGRRGRRAELPVARALGGEKMGERGLPWDVLIPGYMRLQVKKLGRWPSLAAVLGWMNAIPVGQEMRAVAIVEAAGAGRKARRLLVLDLDEFATFHKDPTA